MSYSPFPFVSVIIPFFNDELFLSEAVESVLKQDYQNWELLLVDDGSTDRSSTIAKRYAEQFASKVIYCEHEGHVNKGVCASRNLGIRQGRGELIALLDSDDVWLPEKLSNQVNIFLENHGIAMVAEGSLYWYSWTNSTEKDVSVPVGASENRVYLPKELSFLLYPLGHGAAPCPSGLIITKQCWESVGGFEESFIKENQLYEDQAFLSKIYLTEKVFVSDKCHNLYRQHPESCVHTVKTQGKYIIVRQYFLKWFLKYLLNKGVSDRRLNTLVSKALRTSRYPVLHRLIYSSVFGKLNKVVSEVRKTLSFK